MPVSIKHGGFEVEVVDLAGVDLPMLDEPQHPRFGQYEHGLAMLDEPARWTAALAPLRQPVE